MKSILSIISLVLVLSFSFSDLSVVGNYKGNAGSVRSLALHPTLPLLAAVGLDRHLRIYHVGTQKLLKKVLLG
jgi:WD40 repeat protein